jgi:hypothetical protein
MSDKPIVLTREDQEYFQIMEDLNAPRGIGIEMGLETRLHTGQITALKGLYQKGVDLIYIPSGRKFGKTECAAYVLWRQALLNPGSACYYVAPEGNHGRKIVWDTQRLQRFLGNDSAKYLKGGGKNIRNNEMFIPFKNRSFIQVVGSENFGAANGLTPDIAVYDEFKRFHPRWHIDFEPNLVARAAPLIIIGTFPTPGDKNEEQYMSLLEHAKTDADSEIHVRTTWDNPLNQQPKVKRSIEKKIQRLRDRGEEDVVQREYYSKLIPGGKNAIFPMMSRDAHFFPHKDLIGMLDKDLAKLEWHVVADPGNATVFGVLFLALNPYTKKIYILDEIYEKEQINTSTRSIFPRIQAKCADLFPGSSLEDDWFKTYDEQAVWFSTEVMSQYNVYFAKSEKHLKRKDEGLSLIKDLLLYELVNVSDRCEKLWWEMESYAKDGKGMIPKMHDHLIDAFRYALTAMHYESHEIVEAIRNKPMQSNMEDGRFRDAMSEIEEDENDDTWSDIYDFD